MNGVRMIHQLLRSDSARSDKTDRQLYDRSRTLPPRTFIAANKINGCFSSCPYVGKHQLQTARSRHLASSLFPCGMDVACSTQHTYTCLSVSRLFDVCLLICYFMSSWPSTWYNGWIWMLLYTKRGLRDSVFSLYGISQRIHSPFVRDMLYILYEQMCAQLDYLFVFTAFPWHRP